MDGGCQVVGHCSDMIVLPKTLISRITGGSTLELKQW